jgi:epoxyqueuosine reductase
MSAEVQLEPGSTILLHACCGPCTEYPARKLLEEGYHLVGYFYNPNIHPVEENRRRRENLLKVAEILHFTCLADASCEPETWLNWTGDDTSRCRMCYARRLKAAAAKARELSIGVMTTTLLVSPWQDHEAVVEEGRQAAQSAGIVFLDRDFREGYRLGQQQARADGLYRQRYCGCLASLDQSLFKEKILRELAGLAE